MSAPSAHRITIEPAARRIRLERDGEILADSENALLLREGSLPERTYLPADDVRLDLLTPSNHTSHCPFKGDASYWSFREHENIAWSYLHPIEGMEQIAGRIAFYDDRVQRS